MINSTTQPASPALRPPPDPTDSSRNRGLQYAVINAHTARGRDWIAYVDLSPLYGVSKDPPGFWKVYRMKPRGHETIELFARTFYRARIGGLHFGLYIDSDGEIKYFQYDGPLELGEDLMTILIVHRPPSVGVCSAHVLKVRVLPSVDSQVSRLRLVF